MDNISVLFKHVDLFDSLNGLNVQLFERGLKLLVIGTGILVDLLDLSPGRTLPAMKPSIIVSAPYQKKLKNKPQPPK